MPRAVSGASAGRPRPTASVARSAFPAHGSRPRRGLRPSGSPRSGAAPMKGNLQPALRRVTPAGRDIAGGRRMSISSWGCRGAASRAAGPDREAGDQFDLSLLLDDGVVDAVHAGGSTQSGAMRRSSRSGRRRLEWWNEDRDERRRSARSRSGRGETAGGGGPAPVEVGTENRQSSPAWKRMASRASMSRSKWWNDVEAPKERNLVGHDVPRGRACSPFTRTSERGPLWPCGSSFAERSPQRRRSTRARDGSTTGRASEPEGRPRYAALRGWPGSRRTLSWSWRRSGRRGLRRSRCGERRRARRRR